MNIFAEIKSFNVKKLSKTQTTVKTVDGRCLLETRGDNGQTKVEVLEHGALGYVGDVKPDMQVARVLPWLTFGSQDVAADINLLESNNITHIINLATGVPNYFPEKLLYLKIEILDIPESNIIKHLDDCFQFIDEALGTSGCVFVHCNAGVSRASSVVIAYVMRKDRMSFLEAFERVKAIRPCIRPNDGFKTQLEEYGHSFLAK